MTRLWLTATLLALAGMAHALDDARYMSVDQVKPGMTGVCRTVLAGTRVESVPVEVIGVMNDVRPGQSLILVRFKGPVLEKSGVAQGMSGSPVYVDGRIIGAVAYGFPLSLEPIAGLTPIQDMLKLDSSPDSPSLAPAGPVHLAPASVNPRLDTRSWFPDASAESQPPRDRLLARLAVPLCARGFSSDSLDSLRRNLSGQNWSVVQGAGLGRTSASSAPASLAPGSSLCVEVVRGDLNAYGIGTVTDVIGDRVLAMGHPMTNHGSVHLLMSTAYVQTIVPRRDISFKLASAGVPVGTLLLDQTSGVMGRLGKLPPMVPVELTVHRPDGSAPRKFSFEQTDEPKLMLSLLSAAAGSCFTSGGMPAEEATVSIHVRIELDRQPLLDTTNLYAGPRALQEAMADLVNPMGYIVHNPFERPSFKSIRIDVAFANGPGRAAIADISLPRRSFRAGDTLEVLATLLPVRADRTSVPIQLKLPRDLKPGSYLLTVCDADTETQIDASERPYRYEARSLPQIIEVLARPSPRDNLVLRLSAVEQGVTVGDRAFAQLPPSVLSVLGGQMRSDVATFSRPLRAEVPLHYVIVGSQRTQIQILPPENAQSTEEEDNE